MPVDMTFFVQMQLVTSIREVLLPTQRQKNSVLQVAPFPGRCVCCDLRLTLNDLCRDLCARSSTNSHGRALFVCEGKSDGAAAVG